MFVKLTTVNNVILICRITSETFSPLSSSRWRTSWCRKNRHGWDPGTLCLTLATTQYLISRKLLKCSRRHSRMTALTRSARASSWWIHNFCYRQVGSTSTIILKCKFLREKVQIAWVLYAHFLRFLETLERRFYFFLSFFVIVVYQSIFLMYPADADNIKSTIVHCNHFNSCSSWEMRGILLGVPYVKRKTWKGRKQTNMEGGQSGTYLRLTKASSGPRVSVAKTYRDENETKI